MHLFHFFDPIKQRSLPQIIAESINKMAEEQNDEYYYGEESSWETDYNVFDADQFEHVDSVADPQPNHFRRMHGGVITSSSSAGGDAGGCPSAAATKSVGQRIKNATLKHEHACGGGACAAAIANGSAAHAAAGGKGARGGAAQQRNLGLKM